MRNHYLNYEVADGQPKGSLEVLVSKNVVKELGMPEVDFDSLHQFMTDDIGIPYGNKTFVRLYGRSEHSIIGGYTYPYTRTVYVNALTAEDHYRINGGTMRVLAHELRHRGDGTNRKAVTAVEVAARAASFKLGYDISQNVPVLSSLPFLGGLVTKQAWYQVEPPERRARKQGDEMSSSPHQADILFPHSLRAAIMVIAGFVPDEVAQRLGGIDDLISLVDNKGVKITYKNGATVVSDGVTKQRIVGP